MRKKTRKAYEEWLNELFPGYIDYMMAYLVAKSKHAPKTRTMLDAGRYGSVLRKWDSIAFNVGYNEWNP